MESYSLETGAMYSLVYLISTQVPKYLFSSLQINTKSEQQSFSVALSGKTENNFVNRLLSKCLGNVGKLYLVFQNVNCFSSSVLSINWQRPHPSNILSDQLEFVEK